MPTTRKVVKMGMAFDRETMMVGEYLVEMWKRKILKKNILLKVLCLLNIVVFLQIIGGNGICHFF